MFQISFISKRTFLKFYKVFKWKHICEILTIQYNKKKIGIFLGKLKNYLKIQQFVQEKVWDIERFRLEQFQKFI